MNRKLKEVIKVCFMLNIIILTSYFSSALPNDAGNSINFDYIQRYDNSTANVYNAGHLEGRDTATLWTWFVATYNALTKAVADTYYAPLGWSWNASYQGSLNNASYLSTYNSTYDAKPVGWLPNNLTETNDYQTKGRLKIVRGILFIDNIINISSNSSVLSIQIGNNASSHATFSTAIGSHSISGSSGTSVGKSSYTGMQGTCIGVSCRAEYLSTAIGWGATATGAGGVTVGLGGTNAQDYSTCIGYGCTVGAIYGISIGYLAHSGNTGMAVGSNTNSTGYYTVAIGNLAKSMSTESTSLGYNAWSGFWATAVGSTTNATNSGTAIGYHAKATGTGSVAIGFSPVASRDNEINISTASGSQLDIYNNNANFMGNTLSATGGSANQAICWKADGKTLGYCSNAVNSTGGCTCN